MRSPDPRDSPWPEGVSDAPLNGVLPVVGSVTVGGETAAPEGTPAEGVGWLVAPAAGGASDQPERPAGR